MAKKTTDKPENISVNSDVLGAARNLQEFIAEREKQHAMSLLHPVRRLVTQLVGFNPSHSLKIADDGSVTVDIDLEKSVDFHNITHAEISRSAFFLRDIPLVVRKKIEELMTLDDVDINIRFMVGGQELWFNTNQMPPVACPDANGCDVWGYPGKHATARFAEKGKGVKTTIKKG